MFGPGYLMSMEQSGQKRAIPVHL